MDYLRGCQRAITCKSILNLIQAFPSRYRSCLNPIISNILWPHTLLPATCLRRGQTSACKELINSSPYLAPATKPRGESCYISHRKFKALPTSKMSSIRLIDDQINQNIIVNIVVKFR